MSTHTLLGAGAALAIAIAVGSCALDSGDAVPAGEVIPGDDGLDLWTRIDGLPYHAAARAMSRRVLEFEPEASGDITLVAGLRWRERAAGAINPQVSVGLVSAAGETTLLQMFESGATLRARVDLAMTDALQVGVWYRLVLTIADAPGRPMQVRFLDQDDREVWRSCSDAARCPSAPIDLDELETLRVSVAVDDARDGEGHVELRDISLLKRSQ